MYIKSFIALVFSTALLVDAAAIRGRNIHARYHNYPKRQPQVIDTQATTYGLDSSLYSYQPKHGSIFRFGNPVPARKDFETVGSCGLSTYNQRPVPATMPLVAMPISVMSRYGASQANQLCGQIITIKGPNGECRTAAVADTNMSTTDDSIDMTLDLWEAFGGHDNDGTLLNVEWKLEQESPTPSSAAI